MDLLLKYFDTALESPDGIKKLRELILTLAMKGKLVKQNPNDQPASELLKEIQSEKERLIKEGKIKKPKDLPPIKSEEVPYEVPEGWVWTRLGEISSYIQRGKGPKYADISNHRVISQKCIRWYGIDIEPARYITDTSIRNYEEVRMLKTNDLLWNSTGTGTIGRACLFPVDLAEKEWVADSHVTVVRGISIDSNFLWRFIQSPIVQKEVEKKASGTTNQIELNTSTVQQQVFPLPPLAEQKRIVARIDELMALCDRLEEQRNARNEKRLAVHTVAINRLLTTTNEGDFDSSWQFITRHFDPLYSVQENVKELKKAILTLAMQGKLVKQDPNDQPASELLKEIQAEKERLTKEGKIKKSKDLPPIKPEEVPYEVPEGWEWVAFGDVAAIERGGSPRPIELFLTEDLDGLNWIKIGDTDKGGKYITKTKERIKPEGLVKTRKVYPGDFLLTNSMSYGRPYITKIEGCIHDGWLRIAPPISLDKDFLYNLLSSGYISKAFSKAAAGAVVQNLNSEKVRALFIPLPPLAEQKRIVAKIDELMALCEKLEMLIVQTTQKQTALFDSLLAKV